MNKKYRYFLHLILVFTCSAAYSQQYTVSKKPDSNKNPFSISMKDYEDRVHAIWLGQMAGAIMGFPFEHHTASVQHVDTVPTLEHVMVDDDWYYEMAAIRGFEKYGIDMTIKELGQQWKENSCGTWGSSEQARLLMNRGIEPPMTGHPKYNKLWFTIGPQFSADVYGAIAPAMPNLAANLARKYAAINGYAEGVDGAIFVAGMVSLGFSENDPKVIVKKAAQLIHPESPYRKCLDLVIQLAETGRSFKEVFEAVEDRWHIEYPATNNAVPNGGIVAASVWFGEGDFLKTINLSFEAGDFTDADCNAANAAAVIGAMKGMKGIPDHIVKRLGDRIKGERMGEVTLTPAVDESIAELAKRTSVVGVKMLQKNGVKMSNNMLTVPVQTITSLPPERFELSDLTQFWNKLWTLERAGFGGAGGGMRGIRGITYLDSNVLATYPRDEVRGLLLHTTTQVEAQKEFKMNAGVDSGRAWQLAIYIDNEKVKEQLIEGNAEGRKWFEIITDLSPYKGKKVKIRVYQLVLIPGAEAGNAYWKDFSIQ